MSQNSRKRKIIIDTDPGVDDAMAILMALRSAELHVIGLTTTHGNVPTSMTTKNALRLLEVAGREDIPVAEGACRTLVGDLKTRKADFVHGANGFGNINLEDPKGKAIGCSAAQFIVEMINKFPGEVSILAIAPLTNIALALQLDSSIGEKWKELVVMGGVFQMNGNVNPAAEANIFCDPEAADFVFGAGSNIKAVSLDATTQCKLTQGEITNLHGKGAFGTLIASMSAFYCDYHKEDLGIDGCYPHDAAALVAVINPDLFEWKEGPVRVCTEGHFRGMTLMDSNWKKWRSKHGWSDRPDIKVALGINASEVANLIKERLAL